MYSHLSSSSSCFNRGERKEGLNSQDLIARGGGRKKGQSLPSRGEEGEDPLSSRGLFREKKLSQDEVVASEHAGKKVTTALPRAFSI